MNKNNVKAVILTGPPGAGKTAMLQALQTHKFETIEEPARQIIYEQNAIGGSGVYHKDTKLFLELMLSRAIQQYNSAQQQHDQDIVVFDRGIPDVIGYAKLANIQLPQAEKASEIYRYNQTVFYLPAWQEIYTTDDERTMQFEDAKKFGDLLAASYQTSGYTLVNVPKLPVEQRVAWFLQQLSQL